MFIKQSRCSIRSVLLHLITSVIYIPVACPYICSDVSICETCFQSFTHLQLPGCGHTDISEQTSLACARSCLINQSCTAFMFSGTICKTCPGGLSTGLEFVRGQSTFLQRTLKVTDLFYDPDFGNVFQVLPIPGGISSGRVGYLRATLMANSTFNIDFAQDFDVRYINFHFKARWDSNDDRKLVLSQRNNGTWGNPEVFPPFPFPFEVDMTFILHVLVTPTSFDVYINGAYCCYYNHILAVGDVRYMRVAGKLNVHEMSV